MTCLERFPEHLHGLGQDRLAQLSRQLLGVYREEMARQQIEGPAEATFERVYLPLAAIMAKASSGRKAPLVVGVNGAQGSGKTTLCRLLTRLLETGFGLQVASFSIDDLYLTREERLELSRSVHTLLATRGVPGTHDVSLGLHLLDSLSDRTPGREVAIPAFDKGRDDRAPMGAWRTVRTPIDLVLFEGWCVGARPQTEAELTQPVNALERLEDPRTIWRHYVNARLQQDYATLFARIDLLVMFEIPDMKCVHAWRGLQESKLAAQSKDEDKPFIMDEAALERFIMHYERLTRSMLAEMPRRADLVLRLDEHHQLSGVRCNPVSRKIKNPA